MLICRGEWNCPSEKKACSRLAACFCVEASTLNKGGCGGSLLAEQVLDKPFFRPHRNEDLTDCGVLQLVVRSNSSELRTRVPFGIKALGNATKADHRVGLPHIFFPTSPQALHVTIGLRLTRTGKQPGLGRSPVHCLLPVKKTRETELYGGNACSYHLCVALAE